MKFDEIVEQKIKLMSEAPIAGQPAPVAQPVTYKYQPIMAYIDKLKADPKNQALLNDPSQLIAHFMTATQPNQFGIQPAAGQPAGQQAGQPAGQAAGQPAPTSPSTAPTANTGTSAAAKQGLQGIK